MNFYTKQMGESFNEITLKELKRFQELDAQIASLWKNVKRMLFPGIPKTGLHFYSFAEE